MNDALIITVAGKSLRFRESLGDDILKCLYRHQNEESILFRLIKFGIRMKFQKIIIVGGYLYHDIEFFIKNNKFDNDQISLIYNDKFDIWGSNYSLFLGLLEALKDKYLEKVVFSEGDLIFDYYSFEQICTSSIDVLTVNNDIIQADKSVIMYLDINKQIKYYYDPTHLCIRIRDEFLEIYNSGQVWRFADIKLLKKIMINQTDSTLNNTNLVIIQQYFEHRQRIEYEIIKFKFWFNCNTIYDYLSSMKYVQKERNEELNI